jgi:type IV secretory pathway VirB10-like protein
MNIWFKIAIVIAVVVVLIVLVGKFLPSGQKSPPQPEKTYYDVIREDDKRLRAEPNIKDAIASKPPAPVQPAQQNEAQPVAEVKLKFNELSQEEQVDAERLFEMALTSRKMGRLPVITYGQMVDYCRQIIQRFPGSEFDFKARRMLADIPEQYRSQYKITPEEIDLSKWPRQ